MCGTGEAGVAGQSHQGYKEFRDTWILAREHQDYLPAGFQLPKPECSVQHEKLQKENIRNIPKA